MAEHYFEKDELEKILNGIKNKTLGQIDKNRVFDRTISNPKITGIAGDVIEQSVLEYPADTKQEPDLNVSGVATELKTTGIRKAKKSKDYEAKEPLSVTAVSPEKIVNEEFENSIFWDKAKNMLFVYYLYDSENTVKASEYANFRIIGHQFNEFNDEDKQTLCNDWTVVRDFIRKVRDNNLDKETEFPKISKLRDEMMMLDTAPKYPNSPRFRLKRSVVTNIYQKKFGKELEELPKEYLSFGDIDNECHDLTEVLRGMTIEELSRKPELNFKGKLNNKSVGEQLVINMFGGNSKSFKDVDIFNKAGIICKTITLTRKGANTEQMKLFKIDFDEILDDSVDFDNSSFRDYFAQHQFLCVVFEEPSHDAPLKDNVFKGFKRISFDDEFINDNVKPVWEEIRNLITNNKLINEIKYDKTGKPIINKTGVVKSAPNFPKQRNGLVFVRGSSNDSTGKPLVINSIEMYPQYIWIKGKCIVNKLENYKYL